MKFLLLVYLNELPNEHPGQAFDFFILYKYEIKLSYHELDLYSYFKQNNMGEIGNKNSVKLLNKGVREKI